MSTRSGIYDAIVTALSAKTTAFSYVTRKREPWWDWPTSNFPGLCVLDSNESKKRFCFPNPSTAVGDMWGDLNFSIDGYERDLNNDLDGKRSILLSQIELVLAASTGVRDVVLDIVPVSVKTDDGMLENFTVTESVFLVKYIYNHGSP